MVRMTDETSLSRRRLLGSLATGGVLSISGCSGVRERLGVSPNSPDAKSSNPPSPKINDYIGEVALFRQTTEKAALIMVMQNVGSTGEFRLTVKAMDGGAVYDQKERTFSLEADQELQDKAELFTHSGAETIIIKIESTRFPEEFDRVELTENDTEHINYQESL